MGYHSRRSLSSYSSYEFLPFRNLIQSDYGYVMVGDPIETQTGYSINLQRVSSGTVFGDDVDSLTLTFDFDSDHRFGIPTAMLQ